MGENPNPNPNRNRNPSPNPNPNQVSAKAARSKLSWLTGRAVGLVQRSRRQVAQARQQRDEAVVRAVWLGLGLGLGLSLG